MLIRIYRCDSCSYEFPQNSNDINHITLEIDNILQNNGIYCHLCKTCLERLKEVLIPFNLIVGDQK